MSLINFTLQREILCAYKYICMYLFIYLQFKYYPAVYLGNKPRYNHNQKQKIIFKVWIQSLAKYIIKHMFFSDKEHYGQVSHLISNGVSSRSQVRNHSVIAVRFLHAPINDHLNLRKYYYSHF